MPVSPRSIQAIVDALVRFGIDAKQLGLKRIEDDKALALLWERALAASGRCTLPLELGLSMPLGVMGVVDYMAAASATIGAALTVTQKLFPLVAPGLQLSLVRLSKGDRRVVIVNQPPFPAQAESDLLVLGILIGRLRAFASQPLAFRVVELTEPATSPHRWSEILGVPRVRLGARQTSLQLAANDWSILLRDADPLLLQTLGSMVGAEHRSADALLVAVRALARERLPSSLTLDDAAPSLGLSRRTLQRKLATSGTTLSQLSDEVRRDRAEELWDDGLLTLGEIATKVGFAEQASFTRAWRRWFGRAPSQRP